MLRLRRYTCTHAIKLLFVRGRVAPLSALFFMLGLNLVMILNLLLKTSWIFALVVILLRWLLFSSISLLFPPMKTLELKLMEGNQGRPAMIAVFLVIRRTLMLEWGSLGWCPWEAGDLGRLGYPLDTFDFDPRDSHTTIS